MEPENLNLTKIQAKGEELMNKSLTSTVIDDFSPNMNNIEICNDKCLKRSSILNLLYRLYAEFAVVVAAISVFIEMMHGPIPLFHVHVYFYFYLLGISIMIFVAIFISRFTQKFSEKPENQKSEIQWKIKSVLNFTKYFQFGLVVCGFAAVFYTLLGCIAVLITPTRCLNVSTLTFFMIQFVFVVLQLAFFIVSPKKLWKTIKCLHNFFVFHLIATNIALLFYTVLWESSKDWQDAIHFKHNSSVKWGPKDVNIAVHSIEFNTSSANQSVQSAKHIVHVTSNCWWRTENETLEDISSIHICLHNSSVGILWSQATQYLYPVVVQYYIIAAILIYITWDSKNIKWEDQNSHVLSQTGHNILFSFILSKGSFFGFLVFVTSIILIILNEIVDLNFVTIISALSCVFALALIVMLLGLFQMKYFSNNSSFLNQNFFMFVQRCGMHFIYCWSVFNFFVAFLSEEKFSLLLLLQSLLMVFHAVVQYIFINQFCTISFQNFRVKTLKPILIFLVLSNASLWILECFIFWRNYNVDIQIKVYGTIFWPVFKRIVLPCVAFYRFHSVVLFTGIWKILVVGSQVHF